MLLVAVSSILGCRVYHKKAADKIPITSKSKEAIDLYKNALRLENAYKADSALVLLEKAIEKDTLFGLAYLRKALLTPDLTQRIEIIEKAMRNMQHLSHGERLWLLGSYKFSTGSDKSMDYVFFDSLVQQYPNDEHANYHFGIISCSHGNIKYDQAIWHLEIATQLKPDFTNAYNELAYAYLEKRNYSNARKAARKFIDLLPNQAKPHHLYAEILMREGRYEESIEAYTKVLEINPAYAWAIMGISTNLNFLNRHVEARKNLGKLDRLTLTDYEYRHKFRSYVVSYLDEGRIDSAMSILEMQKELGINNMTSFEPFFHAYYAYFRLTRLFFEKGDWKNGMTTYQEWQNYVMKNSTHKNTQKRVNDFENYYRAYAYYLQGEFGPAEDKLDKYLEKIEEENDSYCILKSRILTARNELVEAMELVERTNLNSPYNQFQYAEVLSDIGDKDNARIWYNKVINTNTLNDIDLALVRMQAIGTLKAIF